MTTQANSFASQQDMTQLDILTIDSFDDFAAGNSGSNFLIDDGAYDAVVIGHAIVKTEFEGKVSHRLRLFWQLKDEEGNKAHEEVKNVLRNKLHVEIRDS